MSDDIDPKIDAALRRHVRRARQILREDKIIAGMGSHDPSAEDPDNDPIDDGKPKPPKRKPPVEQEPPAHPWWGKAAP